MYRQGFSKLAAAENLKSVRLRLAEDTGREEDFLIDDGILLETLEVPKIDDIILFLEDIGEAALRETPRQGHLSALESGTYAAAASRPLSFMALSRLMTAEDIAALRGKTVEEILGKEGKNNG